MLGSTIKFPQHLGSIHYCRVPTIQLSNTKQFLSLRLNANDAAVLSDLHGRMGLTKTEIVKLALRKLASDTAHELGLFEIGEARFGRYGDGTRQSRQIKSVVRERIQAKLKR
jgi:hypothetical protein